MALLAGVTLLAIVTQVVGCWIGASGLDRRERMLVAFGMVPRGEMGIIVAGIGATTGVIEPDLFAVIVGMSILTTLLIPPLLRRALARGAAS